MLIYNKLKSIKYDFYLNKTNYLQEDTIISKIHKKKKRKDKFIQRGFYRQFSFFLLLIVLFIVDLLIFGDILLLLYC